MSCDGESEDLAAEESNDDRAVVLSRNKLWVILITVWAMSAITSAGVGWVFAGISSDRSNDALKQVVMLQRQQGRDGLRILYDSAVTRCITGLGARQIAIHNAKVQAAHESGVIIPPEPKACKKTVQDPNAGVVDGPPHAP